jgi:hypothetical protein
MVGWFHLPLALSEAEHHAAQDMVPGSKEIKEGAGVSNIPFKGMLPMT